MKLSNKDKALLEKMIKESGLPKEELIKRIKQEHTKINEEKRLIEMAKEFKKTLEEMNLSESDVNAIIVASNMLQEAMLDPRHLKFAKDMVTNAISNFHHVAGTMADKAGTAAGRAASTIATHPKKSLAAGAAAVGATGAALKSNSAPAAPAPVPTLAQKAKDTVTNAATQIQAGAGQLKDKILAHKGVAAGGAAGAAAAAAGAILAKKILKDKHIKKCNNIEDKAQREACLQEAQ